MATTTWTPESVDRMTGDEYKHLFNTNPEFVKFVNEMPDTPIQRVAPTPGNVAAKELAQARKNAATGFDPAFDDSPNDGPTITPIETAAVVPPPAVIQPVLAPAAVVPPPAPVVEAPVALQLWEYQPEDDSGRPVGGKQVFKYDPSLPVSDPKSLASQLTKAHKAATARLRELRAQALTSDATVPENATKAPQFTEFYVLSAEQKAALETEAADAATGANARARLAESARNEALNRSQEDIFTVRSQLALANFKANNPDFYRCNENAVTIINYVMNKGLDPTDENNLQMAYDTLQSAGALYGRPVPNQPAAPVLAPEVPIVREVTTVPSAAPVAATPRIGNDAPPQTQPVAQIPIVLSNSDVQTDGGPSEVAIENQLVYKKTLKDGKGKPTGVVETHVGIDALDSMPADELRKAIELDIRTERATGKGTGFRKTVDQLEALRAKRMQEYRERNHPRR